MKRNALTRSLLASAGLALALAALEAVAQSGNALPRGNCYLNGILSGSNTPPKSALTDPDVAALNSAIQDEYKARATYNKILETFGEVMPFANIVNAEDRHVEALSYLHSRYGVTVPEDTWADKVPTYATLKEAAEGAVQAEVDNGALYDDLLRNVTNPELTNVFQALQFATMEHHLPAFQRLVAREDGQVTDQARGRGMGMGRGCGAGGCCAQAATAGPGRGLGLGGQSMRGSGNGWTPGQGRGLGVGRGNALGRDRGYGLGVGRGAGRGFNPPANCPLNK